MLLPIVFLPQPQWFQGHLSFLSSFPSVLQTSLFFSRPTGPRQPVEICVNKGFPDQQKYLYFPEILVLSRLNSFCQGFFWQPSDMNASNIRHKNFHPSVRLSVRPSSLTPPLDSETGWCGELWSNRLFLILEN